MKKVSSVARRVLLVALSLILQQCLYSPTATITEDAKAGLVDSMTYQFLGKCDTNRLTCLIVHTTTYHAEAAQTDDTPNITACNDTIDLTAPHKHNYVALSRDLYRFAATCGDTVYMYDGADPSHSKAFIVSDKMNKRFKKRVDVLISRKQKTFSKKMVLCYCKKRQRLQ